MDYSKMTKRELIELLKQKESNVKYGIVWDKEKEPEKVAIGCEKNIPVLREVKGYEIDFGKNNNLLIEGDNFHSLSVLTYTHKDAIDVIYIDPPYNTGNNVFVYSDKFIDNDNEYRHSKWLSFMEKRLNLARSLLTNEGVIFISIDDNEYAQLKLLCDKIFSDSNFLGTIIQNKSNAQNDAVDIQKNHEYILTYRKCKRIKNGKVLPTLVNMVCKEKKILQDGNGYYYKNGGITTGGEGGTLNHRPNLGYTIYYNPKTDDAIAVDDYDKDLAKISNLESEIYTDDIELLNKGYIKIRPPKKGNLLGVWTWSLEKFNNEKKNILISKYKDGYSVCKKVYVNKDDVINVSGQLKYYEYVKSNTKSIIDFSTAYGSSMLAKMIGETKAFNNPKNHEMIKYLISLHPNKKAIVLDFFAGSGTTAQSVLELNETDGGNRKFILCTNNENNICRNITYRRIKNTIIGLKDIKGIPSNLKYYQTDFIENFDNRNKTYFDLIEKYIPILNIKEDCFILVKETDEYRIFKNNDGTKYTCVYFSLFNTNKEKFINDLIDIKEHKVIYSFISETNKDTLVFSEIDNYSVGIIPCRFVELYKKLC